MEGEAESIDPTGRESAPGERARKQARTRWTFAWNRGTVTTQASAKERAERSGTRRDVQKDRNHTAGRCRLPAATQGGEEKQGVGPEPPQSGAGPVCRSSGVLRHAAFSLRLGWIGHPPALRSSVVETPKICASGIKREMSGALRSCSHLLTALSVTCS